MKRILTIILILNFIINSCIICRAENDYDKFTDSSEKGNISIILNDENVVSEYYEFNGVCFVNFKDFIDITRNKYIDLNYRADEELRSYIGRLTKNDTVYYFSANMQHYTFGELEGCFITLYADKVVNGMREEVVLSPLGWYGTDCIIIKDEYYINLCSIPLLFEDMGYMTRINMKENEVILKQYNSSEYNQKVKSKYNVDCYSEFTVMNVEYYKYSNIAKDYDIYSGIDAMNAESYCKGLLEYIWNIKVSDIYLKYDNSLDIYIATVNGNSEKVENRTLPSSLEGISPKLIVRAFDGRVLYPY